MTIDPTLLYESPQISGLDAPPSSTDSSQTDHVPLGPYANNGVRSIDVDLLPISTSINIAVLQLKLELAKIELEKLHVRGAIITPFIEVLQNNPDINLVELSCLFRSLWGKRNPTPTQGLMQPAVSSSTLNPSLNPSPSIQDLPDSFS
jgi:hypothetical protein